jgi:ABC-type uncharacterized transport system substrate-binding protein
MATRAATAERGAARANRRLGRRAFMSGLAGLGAVTILGGCSGQAVTPSPTPRLRRIGYLSGSTQLQVDTFSPPFLRQIWDLGYVDGRDLDVVFRVANNDVKRLDAMAAELVALPVDVILADAGGATDAAKQATSTIPIVFTLASDPVGSGFVASMARPGGNITGVTTGSLQVAAKRVEVLKETVPSLERMVILWNANNRQMPLQVNATEQAAWALGIETQAMGVHSITETDAALNALAGQPPDALLMLPTLSVVRSDFRQVPDFVAQARLPTIYSEVEVVRAGGLMQRSPDYADGHRRAALMVDKILKGASPAEMPVQEPTQFLLAVNLSAARRIGLTIPVSVLRQATEVVQ